MNLFDSLTGRIIVELTSADLKSAVKRFTDIKINLIHFRQVNELVAHFEIPRRDVRKLEAICASNGYTLKEIERNGLYWDLKKLMARPMLLIGLAFVIVLMFWLPSRVFFIRVEGNARIPERQILASAEKIGIRFGASRRLVRSEQIKNALLSAIPELKWAGINTKGCTALILVKERSDIFSPKTTSNSICSIVAAKDGIVDACTAVRGTLLCQPGQAVTKGQVLISGYTDCGLCIQVQQAEGDIMANTKEKMDVILPSQSLGRCAKVSSEKQLSIVIGKKRINLWNGSGIYPPTCGRMYKEYVLKLPGDFSLPVKVVLDMYSKCDTVPDIIAKDAAARMLSDFGDNYIRQHMLAGSIQQKNETVIFEEGLYRMIGDYTCLEMIGKVQWEQNGDFYGNRS